MKRSIIAATALSLCLGTAAFAQSGTATGTTASADAGIPSTWSGQISDSFFSDPAEGTLLSQEEVKANWASLSADQQAQVREDCSSMSASATGMGSDTMASGATGSDLSGTSGSATTGSDTMASGTTGSDTSGTSGSATTGSDTMASGTTGLDATDSGTTASTSTGSGSGAASGSAESTMNSATQTASMTQLCSWIEGM
jgi:hypothetical protein